MSELQIRNGEIALKEKAIQLFKDYREQELALTAKKLELDKVKDELLKAMEANGIKKYENDIVTVTYIPEGIRQTVDTKALKEQGLYEAFTKESKVKASVRLSFKDE